MSPSGTIHMDTEAVRKIATHLNKFSANIGDCYDRIGRAAFGIVWTGPSHDEFITGVSKWAYNLTPSVDSASSLSDRLYAEANEWEEAAASLEAAGSTTSYIHPENMNSTDPSRIADIESYLTKTPYGQEVLKLLEENNVTVEFGPLSPPNAIASTSPDGRHIVINEKYRGLSDAELAAVLVHEGTHVKQTSLPIENIPILGFFIDEGHAILDATVYSVYPWNKEYEAFRAEAEFWQAISPGLPNSPILSDVENMIFQPNGEYRTMGDACDYLHDNYPYSHIIDPVNTP